MHWQMSLTKSKLQLETDSELLQAVALATSSVRQQCGYESFEIALHGGCMSQIEKREK